MRRQETIAGRGTVRSGEGGNREGQSVSTAEEGVTVPPAREHGGSAAATITQELNTNHQLYRTPRRGRNSIVAYIMKLGLLLLMLLAGVEGTSRWKEETRWKETVHQLKVHHCNMPVPQVCQEDLRGKTICSPRWEDHRGQDGRRNPVLILEGWFHNRTSKQHLLYGSKLKARKQPRVADEE